MVIGGGLSSLGPALLDDVILVLRDWESRSAFLASVSLSSRIAVVPREFPAAAVGAALVGRL